MKKKTLALVLALTLLVAGVVGGTLAWLTDQTAEVKNTFTVGDINIGLTETTADYKMAPGNTIPKTPPSPSRPIPKPAGCSCRSRSLLT